MITQNQIKRTLSTPANIDYIRQLLKNEDVPHRTDLATRACKQFEFYDARGQLQVSSCAKALRQLEKAGHIILPGVQKTRAKKSPRRLSEAVSLPVDIPDEVGDIQELRLLLVQTDEEKRIWNELMLGEHPWVRLLWNDGYLHKNQRIVLHKAGIRGLPVVGMTVGTHYLVHKEAPDELSIPHQPDAG
jgi:hypothetical protein